MSKDKAKVTTSVINGEGDMALEILHQQIHYNPDTGVFTSLVSRANNKIKVGSVLGSVHGGGYSWIAINNRRYSSHRLAFFYMTGKFPENGVDHINHDKLDNRWCTLREATQNNNCKNRSIGKNNKSGVVGVFWNTNLGKWGCCICVYGKNKHLGLFTDKQEAVNARKQAEDKYGYHENHGV